MDQSLSRLLVALAVGVAFVLICFWLSRGQRAQWRAMTAEAIAVSRESIAATQATTQAVGENTAAIRELIAKLEQQSRSR